eukprot:TRINITY_DN197_c0_g1_i3.p1 TRINITY_DN197_c0_g1~~TRINITY_DN197_c0_g1_i3.p1  ORF type:complete len:948 (+),score=117.39 TRINITY_DN197_c0_g1_i3:5507-8350(+)
MQTYTELLLVTQPICAIKPNAQSLITRILIELYQKHALYQYYYYSSSSLMKKATSGTASLRPSSSSTSLTSSSQNNTNVRVVCRVRPLNAKEQALLENARYDARGNKIRETCVEFNPADKSSIVVYTQVEKLDKANPDPYEKHSFNFDYVFECATEQPKVYEVAGIPIVESVLEGFNGTILAYGQTSSGKTFTMQGDLDTESLRGIIPRMVDTVFEKISQASETMEFTVKASMLEIYNEKIRDLLDPSKNNLNVREEKQKGIYVDGLTEKSIGSQDEVYDLMKEGNANRAVGVTNMNAQSSRSHSIFHLSVTMNDLENFSCKTGKLYLVDLAGSEMISKTGAKGQTLEEAKGINKSLTMLGRVINALTDGKSQYIPYRDSKLTRILQEALGGNSKTCLIITASPSMYNAAETLSTCRFGMRAKSIKNNAKVNKQLTVAELKVIVARLEKELEIKGRRVLQLEGMIVHLGGTIPPDDENFKALEESESTATEESQDQIEDSPDKTPRSPTAEGEFPSTTKAASVPVQSSPRAPVEETKKSETLIKVVSDQVDQQKNKEKMSNLEKQKEEINKDMDTLFDQLKQERKKLKIKDAKLHLLKKQLEDREARIDQHQRENDVLMRNIVELKKKIQIMELAARTAEAPAEGVSLSPEKRIPEVMASPDKKESLIVQKLLEDENLDAKAKEHIKTVAFSLDVPSASPIKAIAASPSPEPEKKGKFYTEAELRGVMEDVANKVKKRHEEEKRLLVNKIEQLKKQNTELLNENKQQKETYRILQSVGGTVLLYSEHNNYQDDEALKKRIIVLEKNVTQLTQMYHQIANQRAALLIDSQVKDKSIHRKDRKIEEQDKQIANLKGTSNLTRTQFEELKEIIRRRLPDAEEILSQPVFTQAVPTYASPWNVMKPLRGGGGNSFNKFDQIGRKKSLLAPIASEKIEEVPEMDASPNQYVE